MTIHHSQIKKAEKLGIQLSEEKDINRVRAFWPKRAVAVYGNSAADALTQMQAAIAIHADDTMRVVTDIGDSRLIDVVHSDGKILAGGPMPPLAAHNLIFLGVPEWINPEEGETDGPGEDIGADDNGGPAVARINGVAIDGRIAYSEGTPAGDCPYSSEPANDAGEDEDPEGDEEYQNFVRWNDEWDAAADEAEEEEGKTGTVVAEKYRAKYAEAGHPTHCGDWLAEVMNNLCLNKGGTNLELFEEICRLNGVDTSKYKRTGVGWEGRIRMTGRNLLAKRVFLNEGKLILPQTLNGGLMQAPAEWMETRPYKKPVTK